MNLLAKVIIIFLLTLFTSLSLFTYLTIKNEKSSIGKILDKEGKLVLQTISSVSSNYIYEKNYSDLNIFLITVLENYDNLVYIKVFKEKNLISTIKKDELLKDELLVFKKRVDILGKYVGDIEIALSLNEYNKIIDKNVKNILVIMFFIAFILFVFLIYTVKFFLLRYINKIKNHLELIGNGEYSKILKIDTKDEFEELSNSINLMSKQINKSYQQLEEANRDKDAFLANMSHELKTPLNSINVISSVMMQNKSSKLDEKDVKNLTIINNCGNDLLSMINSVLDVSKLEAKEVVLNLEKIDLYEIILEIKDMIEPQIKEKNLIFELRYDNSIKYIYSDKIKIKQIIKNFLSNSLKFTSKGKISLDISCRNEYVDISVIDEGIGIPKNKIETIFQRFKQVDATTTRKYGGTGLGLAISNDIAKLLGGNISVESQVEKGSVFTLSIPKNSNKLKAKEEKRVLFLHKEPITFLSIIVNLKKHMQIIQVDSLVKFIDQIKNESYDLLVIDFDALQDNDLRELKSKLENDFVIIYTNENKTDEELLKNSSLSLSKTLSKEEITNSILNLKGINA